MSLDTSFIGSLTDEDNNEEQEISDDVQELQIQKLKAEVDDLKAKTHDTKTLTDLKGSYAGSIMFFLWMWFGAVVLVLLSYFTYQIHLGKEIPKEVIISIFTCTAVIAGLAGYVVKGLFGNGGAN